jgi:hypothetical protein
MYSRTQSYMLEAISPKELPHENSHADFRAGVSGLRDHHSMPGRHEAMPESAGRDVRNRVRSRCEAQVPLGDTYANGRQLRNRLPKFLFNSSMGCGWLVDDIDVQPLSHNRNWQPWVTLKSFRWLDRLNSRYGRARSVKRQNELRRRENARVLKTGGGCA